MKNVKPTVEIQHFVTFKLFAAITKTSSKGFYLRVMHLKDAEGIANSVDPDQTDPIRKVLSGSEPFTWAYLSQNPR